MNKSYVIFGSGGHASVIRSELNLLGNNFLGYVDDNESKNNEFIISFEEFLEISERNKDIHLIIGVGDNKLRKNIYNQILKSVEEPKWISCIGKNVALQDDIVIGPGSVILGNAAINVSTVVGEHVVINTNAVIDHDCNIGSFSSISPGAVVGGGVTIGEMTFIGIGVIVRQGISVGSNCFIGASSYIKESLEDFCYGFGVPFKKKKIRKSDDDFKI